VGALLRLVRLALSLVANALGSWADVTVLRGRGRARVPGGFSWLDVKLALRMLAKYPGLSLTGVASIAMVIAVGGGFFAFVYGLLYPTIPLDEGDRLVSLENWDLERNNEFRRSLYDYGVWRDEMRTVEDMAAFHTISRNLIRSDGAAELIQVAEITPSGFRLARTPPLLGRTLVEADAEAGAPPVLVLGYDAWRTRFAADPDVVGTVVRLGPTAHTVVGVMPQGFAFPMNHDFWVPLQGDPASFAPNTGPAVFISGRLTRGSSAQDARVELAGIGERMATAFPDTHARFAAHVLPYTYTLTDVNEKGGEGMFWEFFEVGIMIALMLAVVCANVAVLIYARTATRRGEIAIRTALGASRARIVGQLFVEALVLCGVATVVGLLLAKYGIALGFGIMKTEIGGSFPFWMDFGIPGPAVVFIGGMMMLATVIVGVLPGLQATSGRVRGNVAEFTGSAGPGLGRTWTVLIVAQVSLAVCVLPAAVAGGWWEMRGQLSRPTYAAEEFLGVWFAPDPEGSANEDADPAAWALALERVRDELARALEATPGVVDHAVTTAFPGRAGISLLAIEDDELGSVDGRGYRIRGGAVGLGFLEMFGAGIVQGRGFGPDDTDTASADVVVVSRRFARRFFGGDDAVGRRIRFVDEDPDDAEAMGTERWYEIVGVAEDLTRNLVDDAYEAPMFYRPLRGTQPSYASLVLRAPGVDHVALAARIRSVAASLDPTLQVLPRELADIYEQDRLAVELMLLVLAVSLVSVLLLSAAGIYALVSFTVTQRRREIGIRRALGAPQRALLGSIFARAARQVGLGVVFGVAAAVGLDMLGGGEVFHGAGAYLLGAMAVVMGVVGIVAAVGPARRGLGVEAVEVMR
jgi:predicted permease